MGEDGGRRQGVHTVVLRVCADGDGSCSRPVAATFHTPKCNKLLHLDYLYMEKAPRRGHKFQYLLVIKDDASGYVQLCPTVTCDAASVVEALVAWCSTFTIFDMLNSDGGSHFTSSIIRDLTDRLGATHHIVTPYAPFANGTIERENSTVLTCMRILLFKQGRETSDWPYLVPAVQLACNALKRERLGWNTPQEVFTSRKPHSVLSHIFVPDDGFISLDMDSIDVQSQVQQIADEVDRLEEIIADRRYRRSSKDVIPTFRVGEFVLVARVTSQIVSKLQWRWRGPYRVMEVVDTHSYLVKHIQAPDDRTPERVHARRMLHLCNVDSPWSEEMLMLASRLSDGFEVDKIVSHRVHDDEHQFEVQWKPVGGVADVSWEPVLRLYQDVPRLVKNFVKSMSLPERKVLKKVLGLSR